MPLELLLLQLLKKLMTSTPNSKNSWTKKMSGRPSKTSGYHQRPTTLMDGTSKDQTTNMKRKTGQAILASGTVNATKLVVSRTPSHGRAAVPNTQITTTKSACSRLKPPKKSFLDQSSSLQHAYQRRLLQPQLQKQEPQLLSHRMQEMILLLVKLPKLPNS